MICKLLFAKFTLDTGICFKQMQPHSSNHPFLPLHIPAFHHFDRVFSSVFMSYNAPFSVCHRFSFPSAKLQITYQLNGQRQSVCTEKVKLAYFLSISTVGNLTVTVISSGLSRPLSFKDQKKFSHLLKLSIDSSMAAP